MIDKPPREKRPSMTYTPSSASPPSETPADMPDPAMDPAATGVTSPSGAADFAPEELRAISRDLSEQFPIPIETTELVLMDVDPRHVHVYWYITPADLAAAKTNANHEADETALTLRLYDLSPAQPGGPPPHEPVDIPVQGLENHWHVELWQDAKNYMAELGLRMPDGRLALLAQSNHVQMPQEGQSLGRSAPRSPESTPAPTASPRPEIAEPVLPTSDVLLPNVILAGNVGAEPPPSFTASDGSGIPTTGTGSGEGNGSPGPAAGPEGSPPVRSHGPVASESSPQGMAGGGISSSWVGAEAYSSRTRVHPAEFEIHAELHIYGRGTPGGQIELFGKQVVLDPDGRFSLRHPLSDPWAALSLFPNNPGDTGVPGGDG